jgi:hypothetical protein
LASVFPLLPVALILVCQLFKASHPQISENMWQLQTKKAYLISWKVFLKKNLEKYSFLKTFLEHIFGNIFFLSQPDSRRILVSFRRPIAAAI